MTKLIKSTIFAQEGAVSLTGVSDLDLAVFAGQWHLFALDRVQGDITSFHVLGAAAPAYGGDSQHISGGAFAATDLDLVETGAGIFAIPEGASYSTYAAYEISVSGDISGAFNLVPSSGLATGLKTASVLSVNGKDLFLSSQWGQQGFTIQSIASDLTVTHEQSVDVVLGSITDIASVRIGDSDVVIAADAHRNEILSYRVATNGVLTPVDTLGREDGLGLSRPEILRIANVAGETFGVVAANGSSSISVFGISANGHMTAYDHVIDGLKTRFSAISELEVVQANERAFVLAAGSDDGISVLEILPDGHLMHHQSVQDTAALTLNNVGALTGQIKNDVLHVFAGSETEIGLTEMQFDLGASGLVVSGASASDTLQGGSGNDMLFGGRGTSDDALRGQEGNDTLIAGAGYDRLRGGAGADTFVFGHIEKSGRIDDFNVAEDTLDLSGWFLLYDVSQLAMSPNGNRLDITFQDYRIAAFSHDGSALDALEVASKITINLSHSMIATTPVDPSKTYTHFGTAGNDLLVGDVGRDMFYASGGSDIYDGGENRDTVSFQGFGSGIKADLLFPHKNGGETRDDALISIESIMGTDHQDILLGDHSQNWFEGGQGDDILRGRSGRDRLFGGQGDDAFNGGKGRDRLEGEEGNDFIEGMSGRDFLKGGRNDDYLYGGDDEDKLLGGKGNDTLKGGQGADWLDGSDGDDILTGGQGADEFLFQRGNDIITDFIPNADALYLSAALLGNPAWKASRIIERYAQDTGDSITFDFGRNQSGQDRTLVLENVDDLTDLYASLFVF